MMPLQIPPLPEILFSLDGDVKGNLVLGNLVLAEQRGGVPAPRLSRRRGKGIARSVPALSKTLPSS